MMYICDDCGAATERSDRCPFCDSPYLERADTCPVCHKIMRSGRDCCKECGHKAKQTLSDALSQLDPAQIKYLDFELDGVSLLDFWNEN